MRAQPDCIHISVLSLHWMALCSAYGEGSGGRVKGRGGGGRGGFSECSHGQKFPGWIAQKGPAILRVPFMFQNFWKNSTHIYI